MKLIFDIGFNKGEFTLECFKRFPSCRVVGVEANPSLCYDSFKHEQLTVLNHVVSHTGGEKVDFFIEPYQSGISTASKHFMENSRFTKGSMHLRPHSANWLPSLKVSTITIDNLIEHFGEPDIIKADVEGYEYEVFKGLNKKSGKLCFEWTEEEYESLIKTVDHLQHLGYKEFGMIGYFEEGNVFEKVTYSDKGDPHLEEPKEYFDWKAIKQEMDSFCNPDRRVDYGMMWSK